MKVVVLMLFLSTTLAHASIVRLGSCAGTTGCTPSSTGIFALELAFAYRSGSTTAPTLPSGWMSIAAPATASGGTVGSMQIACRVSLSASPAASGAFTNATNVGIVTYSGTGARTLLDCPTRAVAIGGTSAASAQTGTSASYSTLSMNNTNGTSWVVAALGDSASSLCTPSGMTNIAGATLGAIAVADTNAAVSGWPTTACPVASSTWLSYVVEIISPTPPPVLSQLVHSDGGMGTTPSQDGHGSYFQRDIDPTGAGNTEIISLLYSYGASTTLSISTDKSQTATRAVFCSDTGNGLTFATYYIQNLNAGTSKLYFTFSVAVPSFSEAHSEWSGMLTSGTATDGTASCSSGIRPSTNNLGNLADATGVTTTSNGDLIYYSAWDENIIYNIASPIDDIIFEPGFTGLFGELFLGSVAQAMIQGAAGTIKPNISFIQSSHDSFGQMTVAFKTNSGAGTPRSNGKILRQSQQNINSGWTSAAFVFPCDAGNFINASAENNTGTNGAHINTWADTAANTWASINPGGTNYPQYWYAVNATCNGQNFIYETNVQTTSSTRITIYEVTGASTSSPVDLGSAAIGTTQNAEITTLAASVTSPTQSSLSVVSGAGINNGSYLMIATEVVYVVSGGGTSLLTVNRGQWGTAALASIPAGTSLLNTLSANSPSTTTAQANEIIFCSMNQGVGANWDTLNATYDFGAFPQQSDTDPWSNGDGNCHAYASSPGTYNIGWYLANQSQATNGFSSAYAVKLQGSGAARRRRASVIER